MWVCVCPDLGSPELPELLCAGEVRAAHVLPQLLGVGDIVVQVVGDVHQAWGRGQEVGDYTEIPACSWTDQVVTLGKTEQGNVAYFNLFQQYKEMCLNAVEIQVCTSEQIQKNIKKQGFLKQAFLCGQPLQVEGGAVCGVGHGAAVVAVVEENGRLPAFRASQAPGPLDAGQDPHRAVVGPPPLHVPHLGLDLHVSWGARHIYTHGSDKTVINLEEKCQEPHWKEILQTHYMLTV